MKYRKIKLFGCMAFGTYAQVELTRLIINYWSDYGLTKPFYLELVLLWFVYFAAFYCFYHISKEKES